MPENIFHTFKKNNDSEELPRNYIEMETKEAYWKIIYNNHSAEEKPKLCIIVGASHYGIEDCLEKETLELEKESAKYLKYYSDKYSIPDSEGDIIKVSFLPVEGQDDQRKIEINTMPAF